MIHPEFISSPYILDVWLRVSLELSTALSEQELDGGKVLLIERGVLIELFSGCRSDPQDVFLSHLVLPDKLPEVDLGLVRLLADFPQTLSVEGKNISLDTRQTRAPRHRLCDG